MSENLLVQNQLIRQEANELLYDKGLHELLIRYGIPHYTGSYFLQLMTWRDLDIYLEVEELSNERFFELGQLLDKLLHPVKMSFRNESIARTPGLPCGLYWGVYLGNERNGAWKIDIWMMNSNECATGIQNCIDLAGQLSEKTRSYILEIKSQCWKDPAYRKSYLSMDIYDAVLKNGITNFGDFRLWLK